MAESIQLAPVFAPGLVPAMADSSIGGEECQPELQGRSAPSPGALCLGQARPVEVLQIAKPFLLGQPIPIDEVREEVGAIEIELLGHRGEFPASGSLEPFAVVIVGQGERSRVRPQGPQENGTVSGFAAWSHGGSAEPTEQRRCNLLDRRKPPKPALWNDARIRSLRLDPVPIALRVPADLATELSHGLAWRSAEPPEGAKLKGVLVERHPN